jgi:hypothetical protein
MANNAPGGALNDTEIINAVRWRFRICRYLFRAGGAWLLLGIAGAFLAESAQLDWSWLCYAIAAQIVGVGIYSAALAMTLAIYRCPVCDKYLSRFRPRKAFCPSCGAKVAEDK